MSITPSIIDDRDLPRPIKMSATKIANSVDCSLASARERICTQEHIAACACTHHTGICLGCGWVISVGSDGTEYGHRRGDYGSETIVDCPHRSGSVDPSGYDVGNRGEGGDAD